MKKIFSALVLLLLASGAQAALEPSGLEAISAKKEVDLFTFDVDASGIVNIYTQSFSPANLALSLWSTTSAAPTAADWSLVASNDDTATLNYFEVNQDSDAQIKPTLSAGQYLVSIYGSGITPTGSLLADGFTGGITTNTATVNFPYFLIVDGANVTAGSLSYQSSVSAVPLPAAVWLFGSGLMTFLGFSKRKGQRQAI